MRVYNGLCDEGVARQVFTKAKVPADELALLGNVVVQQHDKKYGQLCWATFDAKQQPTYVLRRKADGTLRVLRVDDGFRKYFDWAMLDLNKHQLMDD